MSIAKSINKITKEASQLRESLYGTILALPLGRQVVQEKSENSFVINTKDLDNGILSPYYYLYDKQYQMIVESLRNIQMNRILPFLKEALDSKVIVHKGCRHKLNPAVIKYVRDAIKE